MGPQARKFRTIKSFLAREGSDASALDRARRLVGIGRTQASALNNGVDALKKKENRESLDRAYERFVPRPGSAAHQSLHADVQARLDSRSKSDIEMLDRYVVPLAFGPWADVALDPRRSAADRLVFGVIAQRALFDWSYKLVAARNQFCCGGPNDGFVERGTAVIDELVGLLAQHRDPPAGLFPDVASQSAKVAGYRALRTKILNDRLGWYGCGPYADDHEKRAEVYANAYGSGLADDLMYLYSIDPDVAHPNNAWNLAMHAGDWAESVRFAAELFTGYPELLHSEVMGLPPVCEDETVWPGVAAVVADARFHELDAFRDKLRDGRYSKMMAAVAAMVDRVRRNRTYLEVLKMESVR